MNKEVEPKTVDGRRKDEKMRRGWGWLDVGADHSVRIIVTSDLSLSSTKLVTADAFPVQRNS